jgi:hypothetical protein
VPAEGPPEPPAGQTAGKEPAGTRDPFFGFLKRAGILALHHYLVGPLLMLLVAAPGFGVFFIVHEWTVNLPRAGRSGPPRELACQELANGGVEENEYIVVTGFRVLPEGLLDEYGFVREGPDGKRRIEVAPLGGTSGRSGACLIVETDKVVTLPQAIELQLSNRLEGIVVRDTGPEWHAKKVDGPGKRPWLLQHGKTPPTLLGTYLMIGWGVVLILVGVPVWLLVGWGLCIGIKGVFCEKKGTGIPPARG